MTMRLTFGAQIPGNQTDFSLMRDVAQTMDGTRWHSAWTYDHFVPPLDFMDETGDSLEGWMSLAALGEATSTLMLGTLVSAVTYRSPSLVAKMTATLDHNTGGRAILGLGAAGHAREHGFYGWDFPSIRERSDRLEEATELIRALLHTEGRVDYQGKHYQLSNAPFAPRVHSDHPGGFVQIMIGGNGERRTLRTLARYGDICNIRGTPEEVSRLIGVIHQHCAEAGRDPSEIYLTTVMRPALVYEHHKIDRLRQIHGEGLPEEDLQHLPIGPAEHLISVFEQYEAVGIQGFVFESIPNNPRLYEQFDELVLSAFDD